MSPSRSHLLPCNFTHQGGGGNVSITKASKKRAASYGGPGRLTYVYDERGRTLFSKSKGSGPNDGSMGFTGSTVTVSFGSVICTYDENGQTLYARAA
jgi:hypothetical protein